MRAHASALSSVSWGGEAGGRRFPRRGKNLIAPRHSFDLEHAIDLEHQITQVERFGEDACLGHRASGLQRHGREAGDEHHARIGHNLGAALRSEEHTSELQSLMRNSYAVFCLKTKTN